MAVAAYGADKQLTIRYGDAVGPDGRRRMAPGEGMGVMDDGIEFVKSSSCHEGGCVEAVAIDGDIVMRDSKDKNGPRLRFTEDEWNTFITAVVRGEFATKRLRGLALQASQR